MYVFILPASDSFSILQSRPITKKSFSYFSEFPYQACLNIYWQAEDLGNVVALMIIRQLAMLRLSWILTEVEKVCRLRVCQVSVLGLLLLKCEKCKKSKGNRAYICYHGYGKRKLDKSIYA